MTLMTSHLTSVILCTVVQIVSHGQFENFMGLFESYRWPQKHPNSENPYQREEPPTVVGHAFPKRVWL